MTNSADPDQLASLDLQFAKAGLSGLSRTRVKIKSLFSLEKLLFFSPFHYEYKNCILYISFFFHMSWVLFHSFS